MNIMGLCAILVASGSYLTSKNKTIEFNSIKRIYLLGSIFLIIAGFIVIIFAVYNLEELLDLGFRGSNLAVTAAMVLIPFYLGTRNFISFNNPEKQFDPMKYSKESMFLGMFRRGSYSLFKLILGVVFCSSVAFIAEMIHTLI